MLNENEPEEIGELLAEESKPEIPEKYRAKSLEDVVRMHQEAEKLIGRQAQEVGEVRKLADDLIKQNLSSKQSTIEPEPEVDFFENPQKAVQSTIDRHPDVVAARQAGQDFKKMQIQQKLSKEHPDFTQVVNDSGFQDWVKASPIRMGLYARADGDFDFDSANELLSTYKELRGVKTQQASTADSASRTKSMKAAQVDSGGSGESSKRVYRRADLIRLMTEDPARYQSLNSEILQAYAEGRVKT